MESGIVPSVWILSYKTIFWRFLSSIMNFCQSGSTIALRRYSSVQLWCLASICFFFYQLLCLMLILMWDVFICLDLCISLPNSFYWWVCTCTRYTIPPDVETSCCQCCCCTSLSSWPRVESPHLVFLYCSFRSGEQNNQTFLCH